MFKEIWKYHVPFMLCNCLYVYL